MVTDGWLRNPEAFRNLGNSAPFVEQFLHCSPCPTLRFLLIDTRTGLELAARDRSAPGRRAESEATHRVGGAVAGFIEGSDGRPISGIVRSLPRRIAQPRCDSAHCLSGDSQILSNPEFRDSALQQHLYPPIPFLIHRTYVGSGIGRNSPETGEKPTLLAPLTPGLGLEPRSPAPEAGVFPTRRPRKGGPTIASVSRASKDWPGRCRDPRAAPWPRLRRHPRLQPTASGRAPVPPIAPP